MTTSLIVLTLNEVHGMRSVMPLVDRTWVDEILVVDGGSTDGTLEEAEKQNLPLLLQDRPGRGEAFRFGLKHTTGDVLIYFSPDGNERPQDIAILIEKINQGYDMVIASRFSPASHSDDAHAITRLGNKVFTTAVNLFFKAGVTDAVNGFRAVTRRCMESLETRAIHFEIELEMTIRAAKKGYRIGEIPTLEPERAGGRPKLNKTIEGWRYARLLIRETLRRN